MIDIATITKRFCAMTAAGGLLLALNGPAEAGLVAHWQFEEGSGATTADSADGFTGTLQPATSGSGDGTGPTWVGGGAPVPGGSSDSLDFDGNDDFVDTPFAGIGGSNPRTVSYWVKTDTVNTHGIVAWGDSTSNGTKWHVRLDTTTRNGVVGAPRTEAQGGNKIATTGVANGNWRHVASVFDGDNNDDVVHFVDGVRQVTSGGGSQPINTDISSSAQPVTVGKSVQTGVDRNFIGRLDDVRIYDNALNASQVRALAGAEVDPYRAAVYNANPLTYWRLGENSGTTAVNEGGLANVNATYNGDTPNGAPRLLTRAGTNAATRFDGDGDYVVAPNSAQLDDVSGLSGRTIEMLFNADDVSAGRQVLYEEGGSSRGLNLYLDGGSLHMQGWNVPNDGGDAGTPWGGVGDEKVVSTDRIESGDTFHVAMVFDGEEDGSGSLTGYLNGSEFASIDGVGRLFAHTDRGNGPTIGALNRSSFFLDGPTEGPTGDQFELFFDGVIDEVALYNAALSGDTIRAHASASGVIPEPGAGLLLIGAAAPLMLRRRRRTAA